MKLLIGSTFPLTLIRTAVCIEPKQLNELAEIITRSDRIYSFWGHENTLPAVNQLLNCDLTPATSRPALALNEDKLPTLDNVTFRECWVVSPDYSEGFRPAIGVEVTSEQIIGWQILKIKWGQGGE